MASQITSLTVVYSTVYSDADQRKHQSSASLAFVWGIHRDRWIPRTKGQLRGKCFHLMTSSWGDWYFTASCSLLSQLIHLFASSTFPWTNVWAKLIQYSVCILRVIQLFQAFLQSCIGRILPIIFWISPRKLGQCCDCFRKHGQMNCINTKNLRWHHNQHDGASNSRRLECLLNR